MGEKNAMQALPAVLPPDQTAFFFDFDGTLVDLAPTPDGVLVRPDMLALLRELRRVTHGAVAIVSGRGIESIDGFLGMPDLPVAGLHGAERRDANGDTQRVGFNDQRLLHMEQVLAEVVRTHAGMLLEIKGASLARRYRVAYQMEKRDPDGSYEVTHSSAVYVFDAQGHARLLATDHDTPDAITHDLRRVINDAA